MVFHDLFLSDDHPKLFLEMKRKIAISLLTILLILSLNGCDKIPDGIVDGKYADYKVVNITAPLGFTYSSPDSFFTVSLKIQNFNSVNKVWASIKTVDGTLYISKENQLIDNGSVAQGDLVAGDGIYSQKILMSKKYSNGKYLIEFFVKDNVNPAEQNSVKVGEQTFIYDNKQTNYPPVLSNLVIPATITRGVQIKFSVQVTDPNSLFDIASVSYQLFKPDGTLMLNSQGLSQFPLFDDGNTTANGDATSGDGIYTVFLTFPESQPAGSWKFELQAKDKGNSVSNILSKIVEVK